MLDGVFLTAGPRTKAFEEWLAGYLGVERRGRAVLVHDGAVPGAEGARHRTWRRGHHHADDLHRHVQHHPARGATAGVRRLRPGHRQPRRSTRSSARSRRARKAIVPVHLYGTMVDMRRLRDIADAARPDDHRGLRPLHRGRARRGPARPARRRRLLQLLRHEEPGLRRGRRGRRAQPDPARPDSPAAHPRHEQGGRRTATPPTYQHWDMLELGFKGEHVRHAGGAAAPQTPPRSRRGWRAARRSARQLRGRLRATSGVGYPQVSPGGRERPAPVHHLGRPRPPRCGPHEAAGTRRSAWR